MQFLEEYIKKRSKKKLKFFKRISKSRTHFTNSITKTSKNKINHDQHHGFLNRKDKINAIRTNDNYRIY